MSAGPGTASPPRPTVPSMHLTMLQEGKQPLQFGHQGLRVVLSQAEHAVSKASKETGVQGKPRPQGAATPLPRPTRASGICFR